MHLSLTSSRGIVGAIALALVTACGGLDAGTAPSAADSPTIETYRSATDDGRDSVVDIYVGSDPDGAPAVVLLHGFGFTGPGRPLTPIDALAVEIAALGPTVFYFGWDSGSGFSADSVADLSCVGPFVASRAAEFGADPDNVIVVGHSMGGEVGSMLALSSFDLVPAPSCTESGRSTVATAFVGIAGLYGMVGGPVDGDPNTFRVRTFPRGDFRDFARDEEVLPGLTAAALYSLDGYRSIPPVASTEVVLLVGADDRIPTAHPEISIAFAEQLEAAGASVELIIVDGAGHEDIVDPATTSGAATMDVLAQLLAS